MKIVDLNVLLYVVNRDAEHHEAALDWWTTALEGDETIGLPWVVLLGFVRLSTNPRVFPQPLADTQAADKLDAWLKLSVVTVPREKDTHWAVLRGLLSASGTAGNLTTDAHIAALALSRDATVVSFDNDFARFPGLRFENPLASKRSTRSRR